MWTVLAGYLSSVGRYMAVTVLVRAAPAGPIKKPGTLGRAGSREIPARPDARPVCPGRGPGHVNTTATLSKMQKKILGPPQWQKY